MEYVCTIAGHNITVRITKQPRTRRLILRMREPGLVEVRIPRWVTYIYARHWVRTQEQWIAEHHARVAQVPHISRAQKQRQYIMYRASANRLVKELIQSINAHHEFRVGTVTIRNQSSRWGSCSRQGNLNFNYKIVLLPPELQKYIVVHELCHILHHNHSARFWQAVARYVPDYAAMRAKLRHIHL